MRGAGLVSAGLLGIWELPQNVLGLTTLLVEAGLGTVEGLEHDRGRLFVHSRKCAVNLGLFIFWREGENRWFVLDKWTRAHEYGHSFQSRWLGPLYLPLVGVPSVLRVLYAVAYRELMKERWQRYFDGYPENWADRLGGVERGG